MARVVLAGYYGMQNFGDDLFVHRATKLFPGSVVLSPPITGVDANTALVAPALGDLYRGQGRLGASVRFLYSKTVLRRGDRLLFAGGSILHGRSKVLDSLRRSAGQLNVPVFAAGVSIGPFSSDLAERAVLASMGQFQKIWVRDRRSLALGSGLGERIDLLGDLAAVHAEPLGRRPRGPDHGVVFAPAGSAGWEGQLEAFERLMGRLEKSVPVTILVLNSHAVLGDQAIAVAAARMARDRNVRTLEYGKDLDIGGVQDVLWAARFVLATRLHGAVVAFLGGTPFGLLEYHPKCTDFLDDISYCPEFRASLNSSGSTINMQADGTPMNELYPSEVRVAYIRRAQSVGSQMVHMVS